MEKLGLKNVKSNKGITLIALIITIVVMLILAGVTINLTLGENGIFTTAQQAAKNYTDAQNKEMADLGDFTNLVNDTINGLEQGESVEETDKTEQKVTGITLNKTSTTILLNGTETLTATIMPEMATNKNITWTSSDEAVAKVENGTVTALKLGTTTITATAQDGSGVSASCEVEVVKQGNLSAIITGEDYGKYIDYAVTVEDTTLNKWRIFYNDKTTNNVYIILDGYLPNTLIPEETGMKTTGTYQAYWSTETAITNNEAVDILANKDIWGDFSVGVAGAISTGALSNEMFVNSWNDNPKVNSTKLIAKTYYEALIDLTYLYIPRKETSENCNGYWLTLPYSGNSSWIWTVTGDGYVSYYQNDAPHFGIRPVVCLPSGIIGTVGSSVNMDN